MSGKKMHNLGIRVDHETFEKLKRLAEATDRSKGSIVRLLIRRAAESGFREIRLLPDSQADEPAPMTRDVDTRCIPGTQSTGPSS